MFMTYVIKIQLYVTPGSFFNVNDHSKIDFNEEPSLECEYRSDIQLTQQSF